MMVPPLNFLKEILQCFKGSVNLSDKLMLVAKKMQCHLGGLYKVHDLLCVLLTLVHFARLIITEGKG